MNPSVVLAMASVAALSCKPPTSPADPSPPPTPVDALASPSPPEPPPTPAKVPAESRVREWTFDSATIGELPEGWSAPVGDWRTQAADGAPSEPHVLAQDAANKKPVFNLAFVSAQQHADVDVSVSLRARSGRIDQGGGVVWRAMDERNYYVARYNPLEDNYRLYYVKAGQRRQLASADIKLDRTAWHTLRIKMVGDHVECFLDGKRHLDHRDDTFTARGTVGLWTKADAKTQFDNLEITGLDATDAVQ